MPMHLRHAALVVFAIAIPQLSGFRDDFNASIKRDSTGVRGWNFFTGDGTATMDFTAAHGYATLRVDATTDRRGIWWALIKRDVSSSIDLAKLAAPHSELRIEARVRSSHAPRRINLSANTQRTTDFHGNLMEFDIAQPDVWQTISFTTQDFDARPGDHVNAQLALMDWGLGKYRVDIDFFTVGVVDPAVAGPDLGVGVPYRPPVADPRSFHHALPATQTATIDRREPDAVLQDWSAFDASGHTPVHSVNGTQYVIMRWDLGAFAGKRVAGSGLLDLQTHSVRHPAAPRKDFGMMRVVEILGGDPRWEQRSVSYASLVRGRPYEEVFNTQMIIDIDVTDTPGGHTLITISRPALQRLLDGRTKGIVLIPLGSIEAAFRTGAGETAAPTLRFNVEE